MGNSSSSPCDKSGTCKGDPLCSKFTLDSACYERFMQAGPITPRAEYPRQSEMPLQLCRDGYHCTCHPYEGDLCCRCGTADFGAPSPGAGLDPEAARRAVA